MKNMKNKIIVITLMLCSILTFSQAIDVDSARIQGIGSLVTVTGIVTNGAELGDIRYIEDPTAGVAIYDANLDNIIGATVQRGDEITVTGTLVDYNGLLEMNPVNSGTLNSSGNIIIPQLINVSQIGESMESELIQIDNVIFNNGGSIFTGNTLFDFTANGQIG